MSCYEEVTYNRHILEDLLRVMEIRDEDPLENIQPYMVIPVNKKSNELIPLKSLNYTIEIVGSLAYITLKQEYENSDKDEINIDYFSNRILFVLYIYDEPKLGTRRNV